MLNKKNRLSLRQCPGFFQTCSRFFTPTLTFFCQFAPDQQRPPSLPQTSPAQFTLIIPKKAVFLSSRRHFFKRRLTELIRQNLKKTASFPDQIQIVIVATKKISSNSPEQINHDLSRFQTQLHNQLIKKQKSLL